MLSTYLDRVIRGLLLLPEAEPLSAKQSLLELGLDSITATNLRNRLAADTGVEMPLDALAAHPAPSQKEEVGAIRATDDVRLVDDHLDAVRHAVRSLERGGPSVNRRVAADRIRVTARMIGRDESP